jgi:hypothetical protein
LSKWISASSLVNAINAIIMAQYKMSFPTFDDSTGPLGARDFVDAVDNALGGGVTDDKLAHLVRANLKGSAKTWLTAEMASGTAGLDRWSTLKPLFQEEFCTPLNLDELAVLEDTLTHRANEKVSAFYTRCKVFYIETFANSPQAVKDEDEFKHATSAMVNFKFIKGLREDVRKAMTGIDPQNSTPAQVLAAAKVAESLVLGKHKAAASVAATNASTGVSAGQQMAAIMDATAGLSAESRALVASAVSAFNVRGRGNGRGQGQRGRGQPRPGAQQQQQHSGGNGNGRGQAGKKRWCNYHQKMVKHAESECSIKTGVMPPFLRGPPGSRGGGAQGSQGSRGRGSYAHAVASHGVDAQQVQVYEDADF